MSDSGDAGSIDVKALMAEVRSEVERKRSEGLYPPEVLDDLHQSGGTVATVDAIRAGLTGLRRTYPFSIEPPITASRPSLAPVISSTKKAIRKGIGWYVASLVDQFNLFAGQVVRLLDQVANQGANHDQRLEELERKVAELGGDPKP